MRSKIIQNVWVLHTFWEKSLKSVQIVFFKDVINLQEYNLKKISNFVLIKNIIFKFIANYNSCKQMSLPNWWSAVQLSDALSVTTELQRKVKKKFE